MESAADTRHKVRHLRIVMMDDEPLVLDAFKLVLQREFGGAEILAFTDTAEALRELERQAPDLFTTDIYHGGIAGPELLALLAQRKVRYPILVISASLREPGPEPVRKWGPGLNLSFLAKWFVIETVLPEAVRAALKTGLQSTGGSA